MAAGLRDANGQIVINEAEAEADIRKIEQAKARLLEARRLLDPKNIDAEQMLGETRDALEEKYAKINKDITNWEDKCSATIKYIRSVVENYKRIDREYTRKAQAIKGR